MAATLWGDDQEKHGSHRRNRPGSRDRRHLGCALHLAKHGESVALVDKRGPGEETSYGNTGVIVGASVFPTRFRAA